MQQKFTGRFKKGEPRPAKAGRRKGTPNKKTLYKMQVLDKLAVDVDCRDPLHFWGSILRHKEAPLDIKLMVARDMAAFTHPKLASIEGRSGGKTHEERLREVQAMLLEEDKTQMDIQGSLLPPPRGDGESEDGGGG